MSKVVSEPRKDEQDEREKPGYGVDRTLIRSMLAMTPAERAQAMIQASRTMTAIREYRRKK